MRTPLLILFFLNALLTLDAQVINVKDSSTLEALEFVNISSQTPRENVTTNSLGQADISAFKNSEDIQFNMLGYKALRTSFSELKKNNYLIYLKPIDFNLNQVIISANRWEQNSVKVPQKISTIKTKDVALQNPQTTADLLSISGNVFIQKSQQGGGSPMIRGFATNRLLYSIDGVRMNTAIFRGGNIQNIISLDPFTIENTEVLFGPGSVIYGSDAIGGVMSFQTLSPQLSQSKKAHIYGRASTRYSTANSERTAHFDVGVGLKKWALVSSFTIYDFDNLKQGADGPEDYLKPFYVSRIDSSDQIVDQQDELIQRPTAYSQQNFMQKFRFRPNEKWDFQYAFHYSETSKYGRYDRHNRFESGSPKYGEWNYGPQKWMMNYINIQHEKVNSIYDKLSIKLAQQQFKESRIDRNFNEADRRIREEKVDAYSANFDFIKKISARHTFFYGAEYVLNIVNSSGVTNNINNNTFVESASRYPNSDWNSMAIYINDEFSLSEKTTLQSGLRYNQYILNADFDTSFYPFPFDKTNINNGALTGSIGAVHRPNEKWVFSLNIGTAFRSPNVDDIGKVFDSEPGSVVVPNPSLNAEYAYNIDFGIAKVFNKFVKVDLTAYYTILENALVRRDFLLNGQDSIEYDGVNSKVQALQNAAVANVYGLQAGLELKLPRSFSFSTNLNMQYGEEELDDGSKSPSRHAVPFFGVSRFNYNNNRLSIQLYIEYQSERKFDELAKEEQTKTEIYALDSKGKPYSPSWYNLSFKAMYNFNETFRISCGIENITNQRYRPYSSGVSAAGRNFIISLDANF